jgi:hypothetical protein
MKQSNAIYFPQNVTEHDFEQWDADRERDKQEHYAAKEAMTDDELGI